MPRPVRKAKKFQGKEKEQTKTDRMDSPVMSTPLPTRQCVNAPASPALSAIQPEEIAVYQDPETDSDEFGFHTVKGIKKPIPVPSRPKHTDSAAESQPDSYPADDEEDIHGKPLPSKELSPDEKLSSQPKTVPIQPIKPVKKPRTSELLALLPARRKRHQPPRQRKQTANRNTSEIDAGTEVPAKPKLPKKRHVPTADKENDEPSNDEIEWDSETLQRRQVVTAKFAEVDEWDLAYETVDVSFSSQ
jgi:hypothetical protein